MTVHEILAQFKGILTFSKKIQDDKALLVEHVVSSASAEHLNFLQQLVQSKKEAKTTSSLAVKQKRTEYHHIASQARQMESIITKKNRAAQLEEDHNVNRFLELPTEDDILECYCQFHEATLNSALELLICSVCAQKISVQKDKPTVVHLKDLPNSQHLLPTYPHPKHNLYDGLLLELQGIVVEGDMVQVHICCKCLCDLQNSSNKPLQLLLANNLWIG